MGIGFWKLKNVFGGFGQHARCDLVDVGTRITVFWCFFFASRGQKAACETVDLSTVIVEVILAGDRSALRLKNSGQRVTDGCPAGSANVNRTGWVGRNELKVHVQAGQRRANAKAGTLFDDLLGNGTCGCGRDRDVDKAGASDVDLRDALGLG